MSTRFRIGVRGFHRLASASLGLLLLLGFPARSLGGANSGGAASNIPHIELKKQNWKQFIDKCVTKVENSDAAFYRRGERVTGKELARQMREYLKVVLRVKSVPDPFGRNAGITLAMITTHEGIAMDGLTGPPQPCEVEVGGRRMKVYDWLKQEFGVNNVPGEEEGHEVFVTLYETELKPELLAQWERYIGNYIAVVKEAKGITFSLAGKVCSPNEVAAMMEGNRSNAMRELTSPEIKNRDGKERYTASKVVVALTSRPVPRRESFADQAEYIKEVDAWVPISSLVKHVGGGQELLESWVEHQVGDPPSMPKLKKRK
ncbi:MAG: hypothetical protein WCR20_17900 [Verrucomicrobiota bacterium]